MEKTHKLDMYIYILINFVKDSSKYVISDLKIVHPSFTEWHPCTNCRPCGSLIKHRMPCVVCAIPGFAMNAPLKTFRVFISVLEPKGIMASWSLFGDMCIRFTNLTYKSIIFFVKRTSKGGAASGLWQATLQDDGPWRHGGGLQLSKCYADGG